MADASANGTAFGFFNSVSGLSVLAASTVAGLLSDKLGVPVTFYASTLLSVVALALPIVCRGTGTKDPAGRLN